MSKNIFFTLILCFLFSITTLSQSKIIEDFMKENSSKDGITFINIDEETLEMLSKGKSKEKIPPTYDIYQSLFIEKTKDNNIEVLDVYAYFTQRIIDLNYEQYESTDKGNKLQTHYQKEINPSCYESYLLTLNKKKNSLVILHTRGNKKIKSIKTDY